MTDAEWADIRRKAQEAYSRRNPLTNQLADDGDDEAIDHRYVWCDGWIRRDLQAKEDNKKVTGGERPPVN